MTQLLVGNLPTSMTEIVSNFFDLSEKNFLTVFQNF